MDDGDFQGDSGVAMGAEWLQRDYSKWGRGVALGAEWLQ